MWEIKFLALAVTGGIFAFAITPPRPPAKAEQVYKGQPFEYIVRYLAWLGCILVVLSSACHCTLLALSGASATTARTMELVTAHLCPRANILSLSLYTPRFAIGTALLLGGGAFRLWCYRTLGKFFTFEVHVNDDHILVTSGPYSFVRHPSYTGLTAMIIGAQLIHFGVGGYVTECGIEHTPVVVLVRIWQWGSLFGLLSLYRRCVIEDAQLQKRFGGTWENYRLRVRYRLLPFVY